jgi:hypothetical protein
MEFEKNLMMIFIRKTKNAAATAVEILAGRDPNA